MPPMKRLDLDRILDLMNQWPAKYAALAAFGVSTGCRVSEILQLKRSDIVENGTFIDLIRFRKLKSRRKSFRVMTVPDGRLRSAVKSYLRREASLGRFRDDDFLFPGRQEGHLSRYQCYRFFHRELGPGHGTHWMRKTFAHLYFRYLLKKYHGDFMTAVRGTQIALGHSKIDHTIAYLGLDVSSIVENQLEIFKGV